MPDAPQSELGARFDALYGAMRADDKTLKKYERFMAHELALIDLAKQRMSVALSAIRTQERWLRKQAAAKLRKETGIKVIPGFGSTMENANDMRRRVADRFVAATKSALTAPPSPPPPESP